MNSQLIQVPLGDRSYQVSIGEGFFDQIGSFIQDQKLGQKLLVFTNETIGPLYAADLQNALSKTGLSVFVYTIKDGEDYKTLETISGVLDFLVNHQFERGDCLLALGGGVVGDMGGFAASIYLRGIHFIQCPTSLLAQVDAAIGGKTGVNHPQGKNLIGSFYQPKAVFSDLSTLKTLAKDEMRCGLAEVVKYGVIRNPDLMTYLETYASELATLRYTNCPDKWAHIVSVSSQDKSDVVSADERESNLRETLNFGHTIGHGLEAAYGFSGIKHGDAVAVGMVAAARIAMHMDLFLVANLERLMDLLKSLGFQLTISSNKAEQLLPYLKLDKKVRQGKVRFVLPTEIGKTVTRDDVSMEMIQKVLAEMVG